MLKPRKQPKLGLRFVTICAYKSSNFDRKIELGLGKSGPSIAGGSGGRERPQVRYNQVILSLNLKN